MTASFCSLDPMIDAFMEWVPHVSDKLTEIVQAHRPIIFDATVCFTKTKSSFSTTINLFAIRENNSAHDMMALEGVKASLLKDLASVEQYAKFCLDEWYGAQHNQFSFHDNSIGYTIRARFFQDAIFFISCPLKVFSALSAKPASPLQCKLKYRPDCLDIATQDLISLKDITINRDEVALWDILVVDRHRPKKPKSIGHSVAAKSEKDALRISQIYLTNATSDYVPHSAKKQEHQSQADLDAIIASLTVLN